MTVACHAIALFQQASNLCFDGLSPAPIMLDRNRGSEQNESDVETIRLIAKQRRFLACARDNRHRIVSAPGAADGHSFYARILPLSTE